MSIYYVATCCVVNSMPKKTPGYVTDQDFPNSVKKPLPPLVEEKLEILLEEDFFYQVVGI